MALGNHMLVFQADRNTLTRLIQTKTLIGGVQPIPSFRLQLPRVGSGSLVALADPQSPLDLVIKSVELKLVAGTNSGSLQLNIEAGILRLKGRPEVPMQSGSVSVALEFENNKFFSVRWTNAVLQLPVTPNIPNFTAEANAEVKKLISANLTTSFPLFDDLPGTFKTLAIFSRVRVVDAETVAVMMGGNGDPSAVTRFLANSPVAMGVSAGVMTSNQLCRALLKAEERDPAWNSSMLGPTEIERGRLPKGDCGTGEQSRGRDDVDVKITELRFAFKQGFIEIKGKFNAEDDCWSVDGGTFTQNLFLDFNNASGLVTPRLEPNEPVLSYDVSVDFLCKLAAFGIGFLTPIIGGVLLGVGAVIAADIVAESVNPSLPAQQLGSLALPPILGVRWMSLAIDPEGCFSRGNMQVDLPAHDSQPRVWFDVIDEPQDLEPGLGGEAEYAPPKCKPRTFEYIDRRQNDQKRLKAKHEWLIEPLKYRWFVDGQSLQNGGEGVLPINTTVRTPLPPPDGVDIPDSHVELFYNAGFITAVNFIENPDEITLRARSEDLNYSVNAELRVTDAVGKSFSFGKGLGFRGSWVTFGRDYYEYIATCYEFVLNYMDERGKKIRRPPPGEHRPGIDRDLQYLEQYMKARNPALVELLPELVKAYGLAPVNVAIASNAWNKKDIG